MVEVTDSNNCSVSVNFDINVNDTEAPTASNLDSISVQCIDDVPEYNIEDVDDEEQVLCVVNGFPSSAQQMVLPIGDLGAFKFSAEDTSGGILRGYRINFLDLPF